MYESIKTTEAKAKAIKSSADKLITKAKKGGLRGYRLVEPELSTEAVRKLLTMIAPRFSNRQGGYTRIIKMGRRLKDNASEVIIEWTEKSKGLMAAPGVAQAKTQSAPEKPTQAKEKAKKVVKKETKEKKK